jgi:hypothetical protein
VVQEGCGFPGFGWLFVITMFTLIIGILGVGTDGQLLTTQHSTQGVKL